MCKTDSRGIADYEKKYTREHEWIDLSVDKKSGVIGISEYAAEQLGDVVYVELPEAASSSDAESSEGWIEQGDVVGAVESVKSASDINAPLRLKVTHVNQLLEEKPASINQVPEDDAPGGGWIAKVLVDEESLKGWEGLMSSQEYKDFVKGEEH